MPKENPERFDESADTVEVLECKIGRAHFAVPTEAVERIIEYRTWSLPLAKAWIGGLSLYGGAPLISVALHRVKEAGRSGAPVKGILLNVPGSQVGWALEVGEVFVFVRARPIEKRASEGAKLPSWISFVTTADGRSLGYVDVPGMLGDLADVQVRQEQP